MRDDGLANYLTKTHWYGVADEPSQHTEPDSLMRSYKLVLGREGLQDRSFPQRDGPILFGVTEPPVAITEALCSDRGTGIVPRHPAVHTWIRDSRALPMAGSLKFLRPVTPRTTLLRMSYPFKVSLA